MANAEDLEKLCQGPKAWNDWRGESPARIPDLRNVRLTLSQRQFGPSNGGPVNFQDTDLEGAELRHANLSGAQMAYANMLAADLGHARLNDADLTGADLTDAVLDNADLTGAKLERAILMGASLADTKGLTQAQVDAAYGDAGTALPASVMPPASWFPPVEDEFFNECPAPQIFEEADLYQVLGVERDAKPEEIRSTFRVLVKQLHPDINPDDEDAQEAFKRVSAAYRILNNADLRKRYDRGEIGADGEVNPEFEAKRQFRRYAFRFYSAAAASLVLAVGVLVAVWYVVLTGETMPEKGRVQLAIDAPPKHIDRLDEKLAAPPRNAAETETDAGNAPAAAEPAAEADKGGAVADAGADRAAPSEPAEAKAEAAPAAEPVKQAQPEPETPVATSAPANDAAQSSPKPAPQTIQTSADLTVAPSPVSLTPAPPREPKQTPVKEMSVPADAAAGAPAIPPAQTPMSAKPDHLASLTEAGAPAAAPKPEASARPSPDPQPDGTARPLGKDHSDNEARPAKPDAARFASPAPSAPKLVAKADEKAALGLGAIGHPLSARDGIVLRNDAQDARQKPASPISKLFRSRAIRNLQAQDKANATASVATGAAAGKPDSDEEVWDFYTHSIPDTGAKTSRPWPESRVVPARKKTEKAAAPAISSGLNGKAPAQQSAAAGTAPAAPSAAAPDNKMRKQAVSDILSGGL